MDEQGCPIGDPNIYKKGDRIKGIDNNLWQVVVESGHKKWKKFADFKLIDQKPIFNNRSNKKCRSNSYILSNDITDKIYNIYDNGKIPFQVQITKNKINVYTYESINNNVYNVLLLSIENFLGYWNGYNLQIQNFEGNSLLIQLDTFCYIYIGSEIYQFITDDIIYDYYSEIGISHIPYPVALGEKKTYFMLEKKYLDNNKIPKPIDVLSLYGYFYGWIKVQPNNNKKEKAPMDNASDMDIILLFRRFYNKYNI